MKVLMVLDGFLGVTAVLGGVALLVGWLGIPASLLAGSPFGSYTIPALALIVLVGGSGALATVLLLRQPALGLAASGVAGLTLLVFEAVELVVIGFSWLLAAYIALGLVILVLAAGLWLAGRHTPTGGESGGSRVSPVPAPSASRRSPIRR
jgi:hypothetical protein